MDLKTICVVIICYNEFHFIVPALQSVERFISAAVILDSNSTDGTVEMVEAWMEHNPEIDCEVHQFNEPFRGDTKRTRAIELAKGKADYILCMDADCTFHIDNLDRLFVYFQQEKDAYFIVKKMGTIEYPILSLFRGDIDWQFTGVIHDYPERKDLQYFSHEVLKYCYIEEPVKAEIGRRVKTQRDFKKDALLIETELLSGKDLPELLVTRYIFYLAQSYRDAGMYGRAIEKYLDRIALGGWTEEVYYSILQVARCKQWTNAPGHEVMQWALNAFNYRPERLEGGFMLMQLYMQHGMDRAAHAVGKYCKDLTCIDLLFLEIETYTTYFPNLYKQLCHTLNLED